jgi:hypothetical protein
MTSVQEKMTTDVAITVVLIEVEVVQTTRVMMASTAEITSKRPTEWIKQVL